MSWLDSFDPQQMAENIAKANISSMLSQLKTQKENNEAQQKSLTALKTALTDFQQALKGFASTSGGMVKNSVLLSQEGYLTAKANSSAKKGLYHLQVKQTAAADQKAFEQLTDDDIKAANGHMKITIAGKEIDIDMSQVNSLSELRDKINASSGDAGVTASLVKQNGKSVLMLSSDKTGAENKVELSATDPNFLAKLQDVTTISEARDAKITMGDGANPMEFTSSTNTFKDVIPGVEVTVVRPTTEGEPLVISVDNDNASTKEQVQSFISAYNKLREELKAQTKSGNSSEARGMLAGDSGIRALENRLNSLLRDTFNGVKLGDFGITSDKDGNLKLDNKKFDEAIKDAPDKLNSLFEGNNGLLNNLEKNALNSLLSGSHGSLKQRQESLDKKSTQLKTKEDQINLRYETAYNRYLKEFTNMKTIISQMEQTMSQFF